MLKKCVLGLLLVLVALGVAASWWLRQPLHPVGAAQPVLDLLVQPGDSARSVSRALAASGVKAPQWLLYGWLRLSGQARHIQAGTYEIEPGTTPERLLQRLVRGEQALRRITLIDGWNYRQVLQALRQAEHLIDDLPPVTSGNAQQYTALMRALGLPAQHPEGRFFPDTYVYPKNARASTVLKRAAQAMNGHLQHAWAQRQADLPLATPDELLTLASIVEKETGQANERGLVAGVFVNRLRIGMRLQTDPSVIYGAGPDFTGRLRRVHLDTDTPYNTYTRAGLPPTPIAMPSKAALLATARPAETPSLYFVARGDGSSQFSATLAEHNRAVQQFILKRQGQP